MTDIEIHNDSPHPLKVKKARHSKKWLSFMIANGLFLLCFFPVLFIMNPVDWKVIGCLAAFYSFMYVGYAFCQSAQDIAQILSSVRK
jgi:hypothetical protein